MEERALKLSVWGAAMMALSGIGFAALTGSEAILLDGLFSGVSFAMGLVSLRVSRLVKEPQDAHYHFGYASYEPLFNAVRGVVMVVLGTFAAYSAVSALFSGGRPIASGYALLYAVLGAAICLLIWWRQKVVAGNSGSTLVDVDAKGWLIDGSITAAVCFGFLAVILIERTRFAYLTPYADPTLVILLVVGTAFLPYGILRANLRELLMGAPAPDEQEEILAALKAATAELPIDETIVRMNRMGRSLYIHVYLLVQKSHENAKLTELDAVRASIHEALSPKFPGLAIDIIFTRDAKWAHI